MKRIEFLYPEYCFIFAENYNVDYLKRSSAEIEVIETNHKETPKFVTEDVDMVYLGCLTEKKQEEVAALLMPYKERIIPLIDKLSKTAARIRVFHINRMPILKK